MFAPAVGGCSVQALVRGHREPWEDDTAGQAGLVFTGALYLIADT